MFRPYLLCHLALYLDLYLWQQEVQQDLQELLDLDLCQQEVQEHQDLSLHLFLQVAQQDQQELEVQQDLETDVLCALSILPGSCFHATWRVSPAWNSSFLCRALANAILVL